MKNPAQKIKATTQKFTEIEDIIDDVVLLSYGNACLVIEATAANFALLSTAEQSAKIYAYASLLNSLSFPIQILVISKKIDISSYLKLLDMEAAKTQNQTLAGKIKLYREFVESMVKLNSVLDKKFYIVIPYSSLEEGAIKVVQKQSHFESAKKSLKLKETALTSQLARLNLHAKTLKKDQLIKLFHNIYNNGSSQVSDSSSNIQASIVRKV